MNDIILLVFILVIFTSDQQLNEQTKTVRLRLTIPAVTMMSV